MPISADASSEEMDQWSRVCFLLPVAIAAERIAADLFHNHLKSGRPSPGSSSEPPAIGGFTYTLDPQVGWYWSHEDQAWVMDLVEILFIDFPLMVSSRDFLSLVREFKRQVEQFYDDQGAGQTEIWCVVHPIQLV